MFSKKILNMNYSGKATNEEIALRFDEDVARFSNLETGQQTIIDASLAMELCTEAARCVNPDATHLLDIGCGAGNYTMKMLTKMAGLSCTLNDLSLPMLSKARERVSAHTSGEVITLQQDMRELDLPDHHYDIIFAAATLHHLRSDEDWENMFAKLYRMLKPGGSIWISDLIIHECHQVEKLFKDSYGAYLETLGGEGYSQKVFDYIEYEDTPRSLNYQLALLDHVGFSKTEILHKNSYFATFGAIK